MDSMSSEQYNGAGDNQFSQSYNQDGGYSRSSEKTGDDGKIFVGGLSWETTAKDLKEFFAKYGDVVDCTLKTDPTTGRSRGFGFVTFGDPSVVDKVCASRDHYLHGRNIDPKKAKARGQIEPVKKIFVGGLDPTLSEAEIKEFFQSYGTVTEIDLPFDKQKSQRRAFAFVTFESEEAVEAVTSNAKVTIKDREVDVKKATPREQQGQWGGGGGGWNQGGWNQGGWNQGGRGGGRGGRGGRGGGNSWNGGNPGQGGWGGPGGGYDYSQYYGNQPGGYDYSQYYNYAGYPGYDYSQYYSQGYDYSGWYNQQQQQPQQGGEPSGGQQSGYGKQKTPQAGGGGGRGGGGYHPYQRS